MRHSRMHGLARAICLEGSVQHSGRFTELSNQHIGFKRATANKKIYVIKCLIGLQHAVNISLADSQAAAALPRSQELSDRGGHSASKRCGSNRAEDVSTKHISLRWVGVTYGSC